MSYCIVAVTSGIHQNGYNLITKNWYFKNHSSPFG